MADRPATAPRILLLFFSLSGQTRRLIRAMADGMRAAGADVVEARLRPERPIPFPLPSLRRTFWMMLRTFFRARTPIRPLAPEARSGRFDLVVLAGPTWSFNPSGPVLAFLDRDGAAVLGGRTVLPVISCRGYWRAHWWGLYGRIRRCGGRPLAPWVYTHPVAEPWRTLGVLLTIAGWNVKRVGFLARRYAHYGHSEDQVRDAAEKGRRFVRWMADRPPGG
ncbi:hypothetical protein G3N55_10425 [Dissulfurirhabdus thermomarina]|uniref:Flavodoxin n=1 Tax=Dissulfurirhabdus thermomarina TaxID=1765737 RepID=A0A6N9TU38_DISTH|nr:hypothetical protein [Dissulfurirhabdus thermomarina]NDY43254.1 hypothetical protein [Dissulfurirhabdus thermomarina]NMX23127.1 hypothetical protein [Dissulfurirhabdus thermomarina]